SYLCIFGPMMRRSSWPKACGPRLIRSHSPKTKQFSWGGGLMSRTIVLVVVVAFVAVVAIGAIYQWLVPGLSSARTEPGQVETRVATWLLHRSVPADAEARTNPLKNDAAEIAAGSALFKQKCEVCHAYDG